MTGATASLTLVDGSTFCVSDCGADIRPEHPQGLFVRDTRVLSCWRLEIDGAAPEVLRTERTEPFAGVVVSRVPRSIGHPDSTLVVLRSRYVGEGMREDIEVRNVRAEAVHCVVRLIIDADFADLFEVKDHRLPNEGETTLEAVDGGIRLTRVRDTVTSAVTVRPDRPGTVDADSLSWHITLAGHQQWRTTLEVVPAFDGVQRRLVHPATDHPTHSVAMQRLTEWRGRSPMLRTGDADLAALLQRSVEDLGSLRIYDPEHPGRPVIAAGAPWFMALFGRDALITSWMLLPLDRSVALGTLRTLADHQGVVRDPRTEEQPGRILHEIRFGPVTRGPRGRSIYYGSADATALFVALLGEYSRWAGIDDAVRELLPYADRALEWMAVHGDADGDGFVEYERGTPSGLFNQGWKDSEDGVTFADGTIARPPIALAEVQAYGYAALVARAEIAEHLGDNVRARELRARAARLKRAFNETFWLPQRGWFALALDGDKQPVDSLTSNMGHCLWTGIVDQDKAAQVAHHLVSADLFTGWGIRTLADGMGAYNPMSYHDGSVWPHDTALCAAGLRRYGFVDEARQVAAAMISAGAHFDHRLPELFGGFSREQFPSPVPYPTACSPQAWAAATPLSLLRTLLGLEPDVPAGTVAIAPILPDAALPLELTGLRFGDASADVRVQATGTTVSGLEFSGLQLLYPAGDG